MSEDEYWKEYSPEARAVLQKWIAPILDSVRRAYETGERNKLMTALFVCCLFQIEIPAWARKAIILAFGSTPKTWDDVFGRPIPKGKSVTAHRRRQRMIEPVTKRVRELHASGKSIGPELFETVAEQFGSSASTIRDIFYDREAVKGLDFLTKAKEAAKVMANELGPDADDAQRIAWVNQNRHGYTDILTDILKSRTKKYKFPKTF